MSDLFSQIKDQLPPDTHDLNTAEGRAAWDHDLRDFINNVEDLHVRQHLGNMVKEWRWTVYNPGKGGSGTREITSFDDEEAALEARDKRVRNEALREAAAIIGVKVGHGGDVISCACGSCVARREDHGAILALITEDQSDE